MPKQPPHSAAKLSERKSIRLNYALLSWLMFAMSLLITAGATYYVMRDEDSHMRERFSFRVTQTVDAVKARMLGYEQVLRGGVGLFKVSPSVSRKQWHEYVTNSEIQLRYPGIQNMAVSTPIPSAQLKEHIESVRAEGFPKYTIRPEQPERPVYHSLVYVEPFSDRNLRAFGFDMYSNPVRRQAMDRAIDLGLPSASGMVKLAQETNQDVQHGFIYCLPVYWAGKPLDDAVQRRAALRVLVCGGFRMNDLMRGIFGTDGSDLDLEIFDNGVMQSDARMYTSNPAASMQTSLASVVPIEVGGHKWSLRISANDRFLAESMSYQAHFVAIAGTLFSLAMFAALQLLVGNERKARKSAEAIKQASEALVSSQKLARNLANMLRLVSDNVPDMIWAKDLNRRFIFTNRAICEQLLNASDTDEPIGKDDLFFAQRERNSHPEDTEWHTFGEECMDSDAQTLKLGKPAQFDEFGNVRGKFLVLDVHKAPLVNDQGVIIGVVGSARDVTEKRAIEEKLKLSALVLENSSEALLVTDEENLIVGINPAFTKLTGYELQEVLGKSPDMMHSERHPPQFYFDVQRELDANGFWQGEIWTRRKNGEVHAEWMTIDTIYNEDRSVHRRVALFSDITTKKALEEEIWKQANFDQLTNLPNRRMFRDLLSQDIKKAQRSESKLALMLIDLDHFKEVNDTLGHDLGDTLLIEATRRITACVRGSDTVARLGGDEFTIILSDLNESKFVERIAENIIKSINQAFVLNNDTVYVSASIGITLYPDDATELDVLLKNADQAMYVSKHAGRNRFSYFTSTMQDAALYRLHLLNDLRVALCQSQFQLHYQPIVELATGRIHKAEALLRWFHPTRGLISPAEFIPLAESSGVIHELGDWVFAESAKQVKRLRGLYGDEFQISMNVSPIQMQAVEDHAHWLQQIKAMDLCGHNLVFEITEGLLLESSLNVTAQLLSFRDAGIQVAIDDFGTGYSALSYLKKLDIDYLKIDQSFIRNLQTDSSDMALCEAIVVMAHKLGLKVIAEGVETAEQNELLAAIGCDYAQGYFHSKAVPIEQFEALLQ